MSVNEIKRNDSLNDGREKINNAIKAFNETVVKGDSSVEAAQARVDAENKVYSTLKERLDTEQEQLEDLKNIKSVVVSAAEPQDADIWFEVE